MSENFFHWEISIKEIFYNNTHIKDIYIWIKIIKNNIKDNK